MKFIAFLILSILPYLLIISLLSDFVAHYSALIETNKNSIENSYFVGCSKCETFTKCHLEAKEFVKVLQ